MNESTAPEATPEKAPTPAALSAEPALWQYRWLNPGDNPGQEAEMARWKAVEPDTSVGQSLASKVQELREYRYSGKPCYEVRALYAATPPVAPVAQRDEPAAVAALRAPSEGMREAAIAAWDEDTSDFIGDTLMAVWNAMEARRVLEGEALPVLEALPICRKCGGELKLGKALESTYSGVGDFGQDDVVTMSPGGPGRLIDCLKCVECGWSVTEPSMSLVRHRAALATSPLLAEKESE